ncbi:urea amidolyase associated protein UAAP1 [Halobacillus seohaensis]|uniref:Urea amidolyase associated protein UAAP1 n=1 Tax=Halobacillus seohaensis TaxID=447421 RepID=A0ABW2EPV3_9BACI
MDTIWSLDLRSGAKWSGNIAKGNLIRITALEDGANLSGLLFNAGNLAERYNMPDTLKAQHTSRLTKGNVLMSDNGRAMASIVEDDLDWHDPIGGYTTRQLTDAKYGKTSYQENQNEWYRSGQENFAMELVRNGLEIRDLVPVFNLFSKIVVDRTGDMHFQEGHSKKGDEVTLRTEMDVLLLLSNTPNPHDPKTFYPSVPLKIEVLPAEPVKEDDHCVNHLPENKRAFENTWDYTTLVGQ